MKIDQALRRAQCAYDSAIARSFWQYPCNIRETENGMQNFYGEELIGPWVPSAGDLTANDWIVV